MWAGIGQSLIWEDAILNVVDVKEKLPKLHTTGSILFKINNFKKNTSISILIIRYKFIGNGKLKFSASC